MLGDIILLIVAGKKKTSIARPQKNTAISKKKPFQASFIFLVKRIEGLLSYEMGGKKSVLYND